MPKSKRVPTIHNEAHTETLNYQGVAVKTIHGYNGVRYIHNWATGYQELVFSSHEAAQKFFGKPANRVGIPILAKT